MEISPKRRQKTITTTLRTSVRAQVVIGFIIAVITAVVGSEFLRKEKGTPPKITPAAAEMLARANGLRLLQPNETAVIDQRDTSAIATDTQPVPVFKQMVTAALGQNVFVPNDATTAVTSGVSNAISDVALTAVSNDSFEGKRAIIQYKNPTLKSKIGDLSDKRVRQDFESRTADLKQKLGKQAGRIKKSLPLVNSVAAVLDDSSWEAVLADPDVKAVVEDKPVHATLENSLPSISIPEVWTRVDAQGNTLTGAGKTIAVIDTGIDYRQPALGGCLGATCKVVGGYDFVNLDADPMDDHFHGTHVAATAAGTGTVRGVAPDAKLLAYKVLSSAGRGYESDVIAAIERAIDPNQDGDFSDHADIINLSLGGPGNPDDLESQAVDLASQNGTVVVAAAGNSGPALKTIGSPANARSAITVAASCQSAQVGPSPCSSAIADFSSRGPVIWNSVDLQKPDVAAPGVRICAAKAGSASSLLPVCGDGDRLSLSGTSMATPHVTGIATLLLQADPSLTPSAVKDRLRVTAKPFGLSANDEGAGLIQPTVAIPLTVDASVFPSLWYVTADPSQRHYTQSQTFAITNRTASAMDLTLQSVSVPDGFQLTLTPSSINLAAGAQTSVSAMMQIDQDAALPGSYPFSISVMRNGTPIASIPLYATVKPSIVADTATMDFGIDNPTQSTWTSAPNVLTIRNLRRDAEQSVTVRLKSFPNGVSSTFSSPTFTLQSEQSIAETLTLTVDNNLVSNGMYGGTLEADIITAGVAKTISLAKVTFMKYYKLTVTSEFPRAESSFITFRDGRGTMMTALMNENPVTVLLDSAGPWDIIYRAFPINVDGYPYSTLDDAPNVIFPVIVREGIQIQDGAGAVTFARAEAKNRLTFKLHDAGNQPMFPEFWLQWIYRTGDAKREGNLTFWHGPTHDGSYDPLRIAYEFSDVSPNYFIDTRGFDMFRSPSPENFHYFNRQRGISSSSRITLNPGNMQKYVWQLTQSLNPPWPQIWYCGYHYVYPTNCGNSLAQNRKTIPLPFRQTMYSSFPNDYSFFQLSDTLTGTQVPSGQLYASPVWSDTLTRKSPGKYWTYAADIPPADTTYTGLGPTLWTAVFRNVGTSVKLEPRTPGSVSSPVLRQDFSSTLSKDIPYSLKESGVTVKSGTIAGCFSVDCLLQPTAVGNLLAQFNGSNGKSYTFSASYKYFIQARELTGTADSTFTLGSSDPNPPSLDYLTLDSDATRTELYERGAQQSMRFNFFPQGGTISSVLASIETDVSQTQTLTPTADADDYRVALPNSLNGTVATIVLEASDTAGNTSTFRFQLPIVERPSDRERPVIHITSPVNGAVVDNNTVVEAEATDDAMVTGVQFFLNGQPYGPEIKQPPYRITIPHNYVLWNDVYAIARDGVGNATASAPVKFKPAVVVRNVGGSIVSGTTAFSAATGTTAITSVQLVVDGVPAGSPDTTAPFDVQWDSTTVPNGSHVIGLNAAASGKTFASQPLTITVSNKAPPPPPEPPPTIVFTSPADGAKLKGSVMLTTEVIGTAMSVQFLVDGMQYGSLDLVAPFQILWYSPGVSDGTHTLKAIARSSSGSGEASISVITENTPATVTLTSPASGTTVKGAATVSASVAGNATSVQFLVDGEQLSDVDTAAPYEITWDTTTVSDGTHTIRAVATSFAGTREHAVSVNVSNAPSSSNPSPTISITSPVTNATLKGSVIVSTAATGNPSSVQFLVDSIQVGNLDTVAPFEMTWDTTTVADGSHTLKAVARSNSGSGEATVSVTVANATTPTPSAGPAPVDPAPTIAFTSPASKLKGTVTLGTTVTGNPTSVEFYLDAKSVAVDTSPPFELSWDTTAVKDGMHSLFAYARSSAGAAGANLDVTVENNPSKTAPPNLTINFSAPAAGQSLSSSVRLAVDVSGNPDNVQFQVDGKAIGTADTSAPFETQWDTTTVANGGHILAALASAGSSVAGTNVAVTVNNAPDVTPISPPVPALIPRDLRLNVSDQTNDRTISGPKARLELSGVVPAGAQVVFLINDRVVRRLSQAPYVYEFDSRSYRNGTNRFTAEIQTAKESSIIRASAQIRNPLKVSFAAPRPNAIVRKTTVLRPIINGGYNIKRVEYRLNGRLIKTLKKAPYVTELRFPNSARGRQRLKITAWDVKGAMSSTTITVYRK